MWSSPHYFTRMGGSETVQLRQMPPYGDILVCGVSTKLHQFVPNFDDLITRGDHDFVASGLVADSVIRLGFLVALPGRTVLGSIGAIS